MLPPTAQTKLETVFGFATLRDGQLDVISRLLAGKSVLAVFPTGAGKSLCYQLPALEFPELTIVVSPLIALMKDQIDFLVRKKIPAARLDSTLEGPELRQVMDDLGHGRLRLLYVAPERLGNERFLQTLRRLKIALLAVDEAHCISEWGHNFRPDYLKLARIARELHIPRVLALTATATPAVATDIAAQFGIAADDVIRTGFHRSNLYVTVTPCTSANRIELLLHRLREHQRGATIIYVTLQKTAEDVAGILANRGFPAKAYHAGMDAESRALVQDEFMAGSDRIVVATIAFGMGIDKADIRHVIHYNLPKTIENYSQEIGRAGRDGLPSRCELLACASDRIALENFTLGDTPTPEAITGVLHHVMGREDIFDVSMYQLSGDYDIRPLVLETLFTYLELDGVLASTGPFYNEYSFQPLKSSAEILKKFDPARAAFLAALFKRAYPRKIWFDLDIAAASAALKEPRARIVTALNYLVEQGDIVLKVAGARIGYRRLKRPVMDHLLETMIQRFSEREERDLQRLAQVLEYAAHSGCQTRFLAKYFGEDLSADCGHCGWCSGEWHGPISELPPKPLGQTEAKLLAQVRSWRHAALASPRQLTRFLCGLSSPAASRAKLTRESAFGVLAEVPFREVLAWVEES